MNTQRKAMLFGLSAVLAWSTVATAFKLALRHLDHFQLLFLANLFSVASLGAVLGLQGRFGLVRRATRAQLARAGWLGVWAAPAPRRGGGPGGAVRGLSTAGRVGPPTAISPLPTEESLCAFVPTKSKRCCWKADKSFFA